MLKIFKIIAFLSLITISGCGSNGTNGNLDLTVTATDQTGGRYKVDITAKYTPPSGKDPINTAINLSTSVHTLKGTPTSVSDSLNADTAGTVSKGIFIDQINEPIYVDVTATTGGLSQSKSILVPAGVSITATPTLVTFIPTANAGTQQTVTLSGGNAPYSASMDAAHTGDMTIAVSGSTITLTKKYNSGQNAVTGAELTVTDNSGNSVKIPVSYN